MVHPERHFEVEIVHTVRPQTPQILSDIIGRWEQRYDVYRHSYPVHTDPGLFSAIENIIKYLKMDFVSTDDPFLGEDLYFIVRLNGNSEPLSLLSASICADQIIIRESLSAPENVLTPYAENAVRGAGTFAIAWLAHSMLRIMASVLSLAKSFLSPPPS